MDARSDGAMRPEPPAEHEPTAEELELSERARAEARQREAERRGQAQEVADFLSEILGASPEAPPPEPAGPSLDVLLTGEPEGKKGEKVSDTLTPKVPDAFFPPPVTPLAGSSEQVEELARFVSESASEPPPGVSRPTPSELADTHLRLQRLGLLASGEAELTFEPESAAGVFERVTAELTAGQRRRGPALAFEPEESAPDADSDARAANKTVIIAPPAEPPRPAPPQAAAPLPTFSSLPPPEAESREEKGELARRSAAPPTADRLPPTEYSLADLPSAGAAGPAAPELSGELPPDEPAMDEPRLDDAALREALAAASAVHAQGLGGARSAPGENGLNHQDTKKKASVVPGDLVVKDVGAPSAPPRQYSLDDLPAAPDGKPGGPRGEAEESLAPDDQLSEEQLPELAAAAPAVPGAEAPQAGALLTVERAVERAVEPGSGEAPGTPPPPQAKSSEEQGELARSPAAPVVGSEVAADLNAGQLAEVEHYLESQVDAAEDDSAARLAARAARSVRAAGLLRRLWNGLLGRAARIIAALDRLLEPWCLNCKLLLGIVGILILAAVIAYYYKTWVLPYRRVPGE